MSESKTNSRVDFKDVVKAWWKFFWRYAVLLVAMLVANGLIVNQLKRALDCSPNFLIWEIRIVSLIMHMLISFLILNSILGKQVGKSGLLFVPTAVKQQHSEVSFLRKVLTWWSYFWRFSLFAVAIAITLGGFLPDILRLLGENPLKSLKYSGYTGLVSIIPASLLVFILLMWRKEKRRKLDLIPVSK